MTGGVEGKGERTMVRSEGQVSGRVDGQWRK